MAVETAINPFIQTLIDLGMAQLLSFVLMLTIVYAILTKTNMFGKSDEPRTNAIHMIIAITVGFLIYISPIGRGIDLWFSKFFLHILIVMVGLLGAFLLMGMMGHDFNNPLFHEKAPPWLIGGGAVVAFLIFTNAGGFGLFGIESELIPGSSPFMGITDILKEVLTAEVLWPLFMITVFVGVVAILLKPDILSSGKTSGGNV